MALENFVNGAMLDKFAKLLKSNIKSDLLGDKKLKYMTQEEYDLLTDDEKNDENIIYNITDADSPDYVTQEELNTAIQENGFSGDYNDLENRPCYDDDGEIKQLDEKFIPDTIARTVDLEQAIGNGLMDFPGTKNANNMVVQATDLKVGGWYKVPDKIEDQNLPGIILIQKMRTDGYRNWTIYGNGDIPDRFAIFYVATNNDNNTILIRYGAVTTIIDIDWAAETRTMDLINNVYEFEPINDYNFVSKKYVDEAVAANAGPSVVMLSQQEYNDLGNNIDPGTLYIIG